MEKIKWAENDVVRKDRIRNLNETIFGWIDGNILQSGLLEEMSDHEFKLYGFYTLAGNNLYCLSCYGWRNISKILKMTWREIIKAREGLVKKDLIACKNRELINTKRLKYKKTVVQVLSLPTDRIVVVRRRKQGAKPVVVERVIQGVEQTARWQSPPTHIREEIKKIIGRK